MKNSIRTGIAVLALAGTAALAPAAVAGADPVVDFRTDGSPIASGSTGTLGQLINVTAQGCLDGEAGTTYMGQFVAADADPLTSPDAFKTYETETPDGTLDWNVEIPLENGLGSFSVRWYCSTAPVTTLQDSSILWISPTTSMTITDPLGMRSAGKTAATSAARTTAAVTSTAKVSGTIGRGSIAARPPKAKGAAPAGATTGPQLAITTDVDALPAVDKIDIPGRIAAKLKKQVDAKFTKNRSKGTSYDTKAYVTEAFKVTTGKVPSARVMKPYVAALDKGAYKVQVVEQIALTGHSAAWWIRHG